MDNTDGIEGLYLDLSSVSRSDPGDPASGVPVRHYLSAQCHKEQFMMQVRMRVGGRVEGRGRRKGWGVCEGEDKENHAPQSPPPPFPPPHTLTHAPQSPPPPHTHTHTHTHSHTHVHQHHLPMIKDNLRLST